MIELPLIEDGRTHMYNMRRVGDMVETWVDGKLVTVEGKDPVAALLHKSQSLSMFTPASKATPPFSLCKIVKPFVMDSWGRIHDDSVPNDGKWHQVAIVQSHNVLKYYVDGVVQKKLTKETSESVREFGYSASVLYDIALKHVRGSSGLFFDSDHTLQAWINKETLKEEAMVYNLSLVRNPS